MAGPVKFLAAFLGAYSSQQPRLSGPQSPGVGSGVSDRISPDGCCEASPVCYSTLSVLQPPLGGTLPSLRQESGMPILSIGAQLG